MVYRVCWFFLLNLFFFFLQTDEETFHTLRGSNSCDHVHSSMVNLDECPEDIWRSVLLQQICHSSSVNGGNVVQDGIHSGFNDPSRVRASSKHPFPSDKLVLKFSFFLLVQFLNNPCSPPVITVQIFDAQDGNRNNDLACTESMSNTVQMASHRGNGVVSNGSLENSNRCNINESCRRAFFSIIDSQKFVSLCKLLSENFRGIKADNVFDFSLVNSRIKEGAYENSPMLFLSDVQQAIFDYLVFLFSCYLYYTFLLSLL